MSSEITVGVVNTGVSNAFNVVKALRRVGGAVKIVSNSGEMKRCDRLVIPGVGSYSPAMLHLNEMGLHSDILDFASSGKPILGICLGMQLLMNEGSENENTNGLGIVGGTVVSISSLLSKEQIKRVPHIGWSKVHYVGIEKTIKGLGETLAGRNFYFAHSYAVALNVSDSQIRIGLVNYAGLSLVAAFQKENVLGVQFHPELSGEDGLRFLGNFVSGQYTF